MKNSVGWAIPRPQILAVFLAVLGIYIGLAPPPVFGQQGASIIGQVTDESGALLPGVTVTVTSPALQVPSIATVTDDRGEYRISPLPIGTYEVAYSLSGFQGVKREGVRLTVGFAAKIDVALKIGALEETITVSGASPVVDTHSTTTTTQLTRETIELLPSSRNGICRRQTWPFRPHASRSSSSTSGIRSCRACMRRTTSRAMARRC